MDQPQPPRPPALYPLLVCLGSMLWGSDLLLRPNLLARGYSPAVIVLWEHILLSLIFLPILIAGRKSVIPALRKHLYSLLTISWGGSALATWLYTQSFAYGPPLTAILLQKMQPLFAIALASLLLGERRRPLYWCICLLALLGAYLLTGVSGWPGFKDPHFLEAAFALGAAALWGLATVAGRFVSDALTPLQVSGVRFVLAVPPLLLMALFTKGSHNVGVHDGAAVLFLLGIVLIPDLAGMLIYYIGLRRTPASTATLCELCYPVTSLLIGLMFLHAVLTPGQIAGLLLLMASVVWLSLDKSLVSERSPGATSVAQEQNRT